LDNQTDKIAALEKACNKAGHLEACHTLGVQAATAFPDKSKAAFTKACQTEHTILQPKTSEELQADAKRIQGESKNAGIANIAGGLSLIVGATAPISDYTAVCENYFHQLKI